MRWRTVSDAELAPCVAVITAVTEEDLPELLPLMRAYCDFYEAQPADEELLALSRALLDNPDLEGFQLIARNDAKGAVGFATVFWSWSTLSATRLAVMNDLFVAPEARGGGVAEALIEECLRLAGRRGAQHLTWQTAKDNLRAQAVYERIGGTREEWVDYHLRT
jgi:GNAT superfamily N-acetyltransferase